jgi:hypothetical protein
MEKIWRDRSWCLLPVILWMLTTGPTNVTHAGDEPDSASFSNWRWSTTTEIEQSLPLDTVVRTTLISNAEAQKVSDKFCRKLNEKIAKAHRGTFYDNPPFAGSVEVTVILARELSWSGAISTDEGRAERITESVRNTGRFPGTDEDAQRRKEIETAKGKTGGYKIARAFVRIRNTEGSSEVVVRCPMVQTGKFDIDELARQTGLLMSSMRSRGTPDTAK